MMNKLLLLLVLFSAPVFSQNDLCEHATTIIPGISCEFVSSSFSGATMTGTTPCSFLAQQDVWFKFTASSTLNRISVAGVPFVAIGFQILSGSCSGTNFECRNSVSPGYGIAYLGNDFVVGETYYIRVYKQSLNNSTAPFSICVYALQDVAPCEPTISISTDTALICPDTQRTFVATTTFAGTAPDYFWYVNGIPKGTNSPTFTTSSYLVAGDRVTCELASSADCALNTLVQSNVITISVYPRILFISTYDSATHTLGFTPGYSGYSWTYNNVLIEGANSNTYVATQDGHYCVTVTDDNGCTDYACTNLINLGVAQSDQKPLAVYPNPAQDYVCISGINSGKVEIFSVSGAKLYESEVNKDKRIPLDLARGIYMMKITSDHNTTIKKLIVQ